MEFSPFNPVVKLCIRGMELEEKSQPAEALKFFMQGWNEATDDFEKFLAAHYIARNQPTVSGRLKWLETALQNALQVSDQSIHSALPALYRNIANCYEELGDEQKSKEYAGLADKAKLKPADKGPFYHGTKADLQVGDLLTAGGDSNYRTELKMNHIYFTAMVNGAGLAAALAKGDGRERVYIVEPTGAWEDDPNVTDLKFPGNPTRSYRSEAPLKIIGEATGWVKPNPADLQKFREELADNKGDIIN